MSAMKVFFFGKSVNRKVTSGKVVNNQPAIVGDVRDAGLILRL